MLGPVPQRSTIQNARLGKAAGSCVQYGVWAFWRAAGRCARLGQSQAQSTVYCATRGSPVGCSAVNSIVNFPTEFPRWVSTVGAPMSRSSVEFSVRHQCGAPLWDSNVGLQCRAPGRASRRFLRGLYRWARLVVFRCPREPMPSAPEYKEGAFWEIRGHCGLYCASVPQ